MSNNLDTYYRELLHFHRIWLDIMDFRKQYKLRTDNRAKQDIIIDDDVNSSEKENCSLHECSERKDDECIEKIIKERSPRISELIELDLIETFVTNPDGSKYLQELFSMNDECDLINYLCIRYTDIDLVKMSKNTYGNYFFQTLFVQINKSNKKLLLNKYIYSNIIHLSESRRGSFFVGTVLNSIDNDIDLLIKFVENVKNYNAISLHQCFMHQDISRIFICIINKKLSSNIISFICDQLRRNILLYSSHIYATRIIQNFVKNYDDLNELITINAKTIFYRYVKISTEKYGNYAIQCFLDNIESFKHRFISKIFLSKLHFLQLSTNKFGSNVIEKLIKISTKKQKNTLFALISVSENVFVLEGMMRNGFGHYVLGTMLRYLRRNQRITLIKKIEQCLKHLPVPQIADFHKNVQIDRFIR